MNFYFGVVIAPPVDVRARQSSPSAPVEISWSPPIHQEAFNITGYEIFYGNGEALSVPSVLTNTSVGLMVNGNYDGETVYLCSESMSIWWWVAKLLFECPHFEVMWILNCLAWDIVKYSCSSEIDATIGMMVCLAVIVIAVTVLCWWRWEEGEEREIRERVRERAIERDC